VRQRFTLILCLCCLASTAQAEWKLSIGGFGEPNEKDGKRDTRGFESLVSDLASAVGPKVLGPAATLGDLGFDIGIDYSVTNIDESSKHWKRATQDNAPNSLQSLQIQVRKGLPFSFELGGTVGHLFDTGLWAAGVSLRYAPLQGYSYLPDVSIRASVGTVLGSREMSMLLVGNDLVISKAFGVGGVMSMAPYAGYSFLLANAGSYIVGRFATDAPTVDKFVFPSKNILQHRGFMGLKVIATKVSVSIEAMISGNVQTFSTTMGANF